MRSVVSIKLKYLCNLINQYFSNVGYMTLQNHAWVREPFKVQSRPIDCNAKRVLLRDYGLTSFTIVSKKKISTIT